MHTVTVQVRELLGWPAGLVTSFRSFSAVSNLSMVLVVKLRYGTVHRTRYGPGSHILYLIPFNDSITNCQRISFRAGDL